MTAQEIFDRVWTHFVVEGNPRSMNNYGACVYRGLNGARCAVGVLIPDAEYRDDFEGFNAGALIRGDDCPPSLVPMREHADLLDALQIAHDGACNGDVDPRLRIVANEHSLTIPEVSP
jgi:hypothetical protein